MAEERGFNGPAPLAITYRLEAAERQPDGHGLAMFPLLKFSIVLSVVNPVLGNTVFSRPPNSVDELPPKSFVVPGMKSPPSCQTHVPRLNPFEKNG